MSRKTEASKAIDQFVGNRIRYYRTLAGMSQHDLAKALDISYQQLHKYENGSNSVSASRLADIADILNIRVTDLFQGIHQAKDFAGALPAYGREELLLMKYLEQIKDPAKRESLAAMLKSLSNPDQSGDSTSDE